MHAANKIIAVTQRVVLDKGEKRDCLDQRWHAFFSRCGITPLLLPNHLTTATELLKQVPVSGFLFTGGNDLVSVGGDAPERDDLEFFILKKALAEKTPLIGVCRGMQVIQSYFAIPLEKVSGHVTAEMTIELNGKDTVVNSYHSWASRKLKSPLQTLGVSKDGVIKALRHEEAPCWGIMWHPERNPSLKTDDLAFFQNIYSEPERKKAT